MSKRDELTFTIKNSLVVGSATATLVGGCIGISNPGPNRIDTAGGDADVAGDVAEDVATDTEPSGDVEPTDSGGDDVEARDTDSSDGTSGEDGDSGADDAEATDSGSSDGTSDDDSGDSDADGR